MPISLPLLRALRRHSYEWMEIFAWGVYQATIMNFLAVGDDSSGADEEWRSEKSCQITTTSVSRSEKSCQITTTSVSRSEKSCQITTTSAEKSCQIT